MPEDGKIRLDLVNVYGDPVAQRVRILLRHQTLSDSRLYRDVDASKQVVISGLKSNPQGLYIIEVDAPSYLTVSSFINVCAGDGTPCRLTLPMDASRVASVQFPAYGKLNANSRRLLEAGSEVSGFAGKAGEQLYTALDDIRRAGLLNLLAKAEHTCFSNGETVLSHLQALTQIRGDRLFAEVSPDLCVHTRSAVIEKLFHEVDGSLHNPDPGFERAGSYKTSDRYGNLQLSFFRNPEGRWRVDMDIDDAQGIGHVFQVVHNALTHEPTHPYNIHELLVAHQHLDPLYTLQAMEAVASMTAHVG